VFRELHPNIKVRIYTSFLSRVIGSMIFPFMAIYFTVKINATIAGILLMILVIVQFLASLYGGYLSDNLGRKKMMVIGELLKTFAFSGMLIVNSPLWSSPWATFYMLLVISISSGIINPAAEAMLVDVSTKENRVLMYSINYWAVNFSLMIGLIVGGLFFKSYFFELLIALFLMSIVTMLMTFFLIKETYVNKEDRKIQKNYGILSLIKSYKTVIRDIPFILFTIGGISIFTVEFQRSNFIAVKLESEFIPKSFDILGIGSITIDGVKLLSLLIVENTLIVILFSALVSKLVRGKSEKVLMYIGFVIFGIGYAGVAMSNNIYFLMVAVIVFSVGELIFVPTRQSILADIIDDSQRGAYMAINGFVYQFGKMFAALGIILGQKIGGLGMGIHYLLSVVIGIIFCSYALKVKTKKQGIGAVKGNEKTYIQN
jgi:DHA1 family multidrug resistance protein B-like MFS transporter